MILALIGACGSDNEAGSRTFDETSAPAGEALTLEGFCEARYAGSAAWWRWAQECCVPGAVDALFSPLPVGVGDPAELASECVHLWTKNIEEGRVVFDGTSAAACARVYVDQMPAVPARCEALPRYPGLYADYVEPTHVQACRDTFVGQIAEGQPCDFDFQCADDLRCREVAGEFVCTEAVSEFGRCSLSEDCADGLVCLGEYPNGICRVSRLDVGSPCSSRSDCLPELVCGYGNVCTLPKGLGEPCPDSKGCPIETSWCDPVTERCAPLSEDGETCRSDMACRGTCDDFDYSTGMGVCVDMCGWHSQSSER